MQSKSFILQITAAKLTLKTRKTFIAAVIFSILCTAGQSYSQQYGYPPPNQQPYAYPPATQQQYPAPNVFEETLRDALYGGAIGALMGGALAILTRQPGKHLDRIGYGVGVGILAGTVFGVARSSRQFALAEVNNGKLAFNIPTLQPDSEKDDRHATIISAKADLLMLHF